MTATIEPYVTQLREEGWCVLENVIPADAVDAVREEVETSEVALQSILESARPLGAQCRQFCAALCGGI